jgi:hypothetical protein
LILTLLSNMLTNLNMTDVDALQGIPPRGHSVDSPGRGPFRF